MGIHGEPGVWRDKLRPADAIAGELMDRLLADMPVGQGDRVSILVNSLGATPPEELYILYRVAKAPPRRGRRGDRHAAGRPLRHVDGDGRGLVHARPARRGARGLPDRAVRLRLLERPVSIDRAALLPAIDRLTAAMDAAFDRLNAADGGARRRRPRRHHDPRHGAGLRGGADAARGPRRRRCCAARRPSPSPPGRPTARCSPPA